MSAILRKYATALSGATLISAPMVKAGVNDLATGSDWSPSAGDVKVSIDGGAQANIGTLPSYSNGQWLFTLTALELTGKKIVIVVVDSATKVVEDQFLYIETFGNASAMHVLDYSTGVVNINLAQTGYTVRDVSAVADASLTVGDGLVAAIAEMGGDEDITGTAWTKKTPAGTTVRIFALDSATTPTSRT